MDGRVDGRRPPSNFHGAGSVLHVPAGAPRTRTAQSLSPLIRSRRRAQKPCGEYIQTNNPVMRRLAQHTRTACTARTARTKHRKLAQHHTHSTHSKKHSKLASHHAQACTARHTRLPAPQHALLPRFRLTRCTWVSTLCCTWVSTLSGAPLSLRKTLLARTNCLPQTCTERTLFSLRGPWAR